jgi:hypothetical protein
MFTCSSLTHVTTDPVPQLSMLFSLSQFFSEHLSLQWNMQRRYHLCKEATSFRALQAIRRQLKYDASHLPSGYIAAVPLHFIPSSRIYSVLSERPLESDATAVKLDRHVKCRFASRLDPLVNPLLYNLHTYSCYCCQ